MEPSEEVKKLAEEITKLIPEDQFYMLALFDEKKESVCLNAKISLPGLLTIVLYILQREPSLWYYLNALYHECSDQGGNA